MNRIFIHGLLSSGQGFKGNFLRQRFPDMLTPDFVGTLEERMAQLEAVLETASAWILVGSSWGGLMATMYASVQPQRVQRMVLLAPALVWPDFLEHLPPPLATPTVIYHGREDTIIPLAQSKSIYERVFSQAVLHEVDDDHVLHATMPLIPWEELLAG
jgi:pimeloyl-ACP methyl ester carboxylesterase